MDGKEIFMADIPTKPATSSKLNWVGLLTVALSGVTWATQNNMVPTKYVALAGAIVGLLTVVIRTFATSTDVTLFGKSFTIGG